MNKESKNKIANRRQRAGRVRSNIHGVATKPRLSVSISNRHASAQLIDDSKSVTICSASTVGTAAKGSMSEKMQVIADELVGKAKKSKIEEAVLDRGYRSYHGRIKVFADAVRSAGLKL